MMGERESHSWGWGFWGLVKSLVGPSFQGQKSSWTVCLLKTLGHPTGSDAVADHRPAPLARPGPFLLPLLRPQSFTPSLLAPPPLTPWFNKHEFVHGLALWWCVPSCYILQRAINHVPHSPSQAVDKHQHLDFTTVCTDALYPFGA